jgi:hypothetical protein
VEYNDEFNDEYHHIFDAGQVALSENGLHFEICDTLIREVS